MQHGQRNTGLTLVTRAFFVNGDIESLRTVVAIVRRVLKRELCYVGAVHLLQHFRIDLTRLAFRTAHARLPRQLLRGRVVNKERELARLAAAHANGGTGNERLAVDLERISGAGRVVRTAFDHQPLPRLFEKERRGNPPPPARTTPEFLCPRAPPPPLTPPHPRLDRVLPPRKAPPARILDSAPPQ